jgi:hypothetical protein
VKVRWGLDQLPSLLSELGIERPLLVASRRWDELELPAAARWSEIPSHRIEVPEGVDGILAAGGGSAIDTAKAASAATGLPLVSVPTTYSGAEWTPSYGVREPSKRMVGGGGGAHPLGIVYDPELTLELPRAESGGTAMNALAHCAEALYSAGRNEAADREALAGAKLISEWLEPVLADGSDRAARKHLLEGALHAGAALAGAGLALGHAMAQTVGGRYGLPHGAMNALCLPAALRFNSEVAAAEIARFGSAMGADDPVERVVQLARQGFTGLVFEEYNTDWTSKAYYTVSGQNSNNSVRIDNAFMEAVQKDGLWPLYWRTEREKAKREGRPPKPCRTLRARDLWDQIAYAAWSCADPGVQYDTTINEWHTCPADGRINASNPCSEYLFLDDTAAIWRPSTS